jgi:hypothetical protein
LPCFFLSNKGGKSALGPCGRERTKIDLSGAPRGRAAEPGAGRDLAAYSLDARSDAYHRSRWTAQLLARLTGAAVILLVGKRVRFYEPHRPPQVRWGMIGTVVDVEERPTPIGHESWVRARFGDFLTPWIEEWRLERAD